MTAEQRRAQLVLEAGRAYRRAHRHSGYVWRAYWMQQSWFFLFQAAAGPL